MDCQGEGVVGLPRRVSDGRHVLRRGVLGPRMAGVDPAAVRGHPVDLAAGRPIRQGAERGPLAHEAPETAVERTVELGHGMDDVAPDGVAKIDPSPVAVVTPQTPALGRPGLQCAGVERTPRDLERGDEHGAPRSSAIGPARGGSAAVDTELEVAAVRLGRAGHAGAGQDAQMKAGPGFGVELANQVADRIAVLGIGVDPAGDREPARSPLQRGMVRHFQEGAPPVEPGRPGARPGTGLAHAHAVIAHAQRRAHGLVRARGERPARDQAVIRGPAHERETRGDTSAGAVRAPSLPGYSYAARPVNATRTSSAVRP